MSFNTHLFDRIGAHTGIGGQKTVHIYTTDDSVATITASGYFPSSEVKDGDIIMCVTGGVTYMYQASISGDTVSVSNALGNYDPATPAEVQWVGDPANQTSGFGVAFSYDLASLVIGATSFEAPALTSTWASIDDNGLITGVPDAVAAISNIIVTARNDVGGKNSTAFSITTNAVAPEWNPIADKSWTESAAPNYDFTADLASNGGATATYTESTINPFPDSVEMGTDGTTTGTVGASAAGSYVSTVIADNGTEQASASVNITVNPTPATIPVWGAVPSIPAVEGATISFDLTDSIISSGGDATYTFSEAPASDTVTGTGLTLNTSTGVVSGTLLAGSAATLSMIWRVANAAGAASPDATQTITITATGKLLLDSPVVLNGLLLANPARDFTATAQFDRASTSVTEGDNVEFFVERVGDVTSALSQDVNVPSGTYFAANTYNADIAAGATESALISIPTVSTATDDGGDVVDFTLTANNTVGGNTNLAVTVVDINQPGTVNFRKGSDQMDEGTTLTVFVDRTGGTSGALNQSIIVPDGAGYLVPGTFSVNMADGVTSSSITITSVLRTGYQNNANVTLTLTDNAGTSTPTMSINVIDTEVPAGNDWYFKADFEGGTNGQRCTGQADNFVCAQAVSGGGLDVTTIDNTRAHAGSQSISCHILSGQTQAGFGGKTRGFTVDPGKNEEYWIKAWFYVPASFNLTSPSGLKNLRTRMTHGSMQTKWRDGGTGSIEVGSEVLGTVQGTDGLTFTQRANADPRWNGKGNLWNIPRDTWFSLETYYYLHDVNGKFRVWANNILIFEDTIGRTLRDPGDVADRTEIFQYWNGGSPATQTMWMDDISYTNSRIHANNTDLDGNPFIGGTG